MIQNYINFKQISKLSSILPVLFSLQSSFSIKPSLQKIMQLSAILGSKELNYKKIKI
jgi:hypothetical protein